MKQSLFNLGLWLGLSGALLAADGGTNYSKLNKVDLTEFQAGKIAYAVGMMLQGAHYRQIPLSDTISRTQFTNYLNLLDYNRVFFLQPDVDEFSARYSTKLDEATMNSDASPAYVIYERFKQRVKEREAYVEARLKKSFSFDTNEYFDLQRNKKPWPANQAEADTVWDRRLKSDLLNGKLNKEKPEESLEKVTKRYSRLTKTLIGFDHEEVLGIYLDALGNSFDPHTDYMTPSERRNFEIRNIKSELTGIGALLQSEDGYCKIVSLTPGGPAEKSKQLHPNDRIVAVAQGDKGEWVDVIEEKLNNVVEIIRGDLGTTVRLQIIPAKGDSSTRKVVTLVRDVIQIKDQLPKAELHLVPISNTETQRLGVINLPQFHERAAEDVAKLIGRLKQENIDGLILDLRRNGGGILEQAVKLAGLFIDQGPIVQVKSYDGKKGVLSDTDRGVVYDGPLIVLVSHLSASASEIVAAALQDYGRALIVGDQHTHGKGTVQTLVHLDPYIRHDEVEEPGSLKFTVQTFYRINGGTTQKHGVTPDILLPSTYDYLEMGEAYLPNALEVEPIDPARYRPLNRVKPYVERLADASRTRLANDQDFKYIAQDIALLKKQLEDRRVSLNLEKRETEKSEQEARKEARKAERAKRPSDDRNVFSFELDDVDKDKPLVSLASIKKTEAAKRAAAKASAKDGSDSSVSDAETDDDNDPTDPHLTEALHILSDYARLMNGASLAANTPEPAAQKVRAPATTAVQ